MDALSVRQVVDVVFLIGLFSVVRLIVEYYFYKLKSWISTRRTIRRILND